MAKDGTDLVFSVAAVGDVNDTAKQAIDNLVTGFYRCGNKLSAEVPKDATQPGGQ